MICREVELGFIFETPQFFILWGGKKANFENIQKYFPEFKFTRVKQTHSDIFYESLNTEKDLQVNADGHFTFSRNLGLCISTADCVPVMIFSEKVGVIASIHAGWRGVENRIVSKTLSHLFSKGLNATHTRVFIGPHIGFESFEVEYNVCEGILASARLNSEPKSPEFFKDLGNNKCLLNLSYVLEKQLTDLGIPSSNIEKFLLDTKTDQRFHSHRRDRELAGRQLSFIVIK